MSVIATVLTLTGIYFLDARVALSVHSFLNANPDLNKSVKRIPNLLLVAVCASTAGLLIAYLTLRRMGNSRHTMFLRLAMVAVPAAFLVKMLLQYIFGRTSVWGWLQRGGDIEFSFFTPLSNYHSFPSGHMTVFTAFLAAVWLFYPRYRLFVIALLAILGIALVVTNHHYLGDVISGLFCGILVTAVTCHLIAKTDSAKSP